MHYKRYNYSLHIHMYTETIKCPSSLLEVLHYKALSKGLRSRPQPRELPPTLATPYKAEQQPRSPLEPPPPPPPPNPSHTLQG